MSRGRLTRTSAMLGATAVFFAAGTVAAFALWRTPATQVTVQGRAAFVPDGKTPTGNATGSSVALTWPAAQAPGGVVSGYRVGRYSATGKDQNIRVDAGGSCAGVVTALTCTDADVPNGQWHYTVQPVFGAGWHGAESPKSGQVKVNNGSKSSVTTPTPTPTPTASPSPSPSVSPSASVTPSPSTTESSNVGSG